MEVTEVSCKCEMHNQGKIVVDASRQTERERRRVARGTDGSPGVGEMNGQPQPNGRASSCQMSVVFFILFIYLFVFNNLFLCPPEGYSSSYRY